jgi:poly(3-hydroxybutyrate) depolymerase
LLLQQYKIDKNRIWATGKSDGGGFVGVLACDPILSARIAAFAPVSGAFYPGTAGTANCNANLVNATCNPGRRPIPFIEFHGLLDDVIPYYGGKHAGECLPTVPHYLVQWAERDSEGNTNQTSELTNDTVVYTFPGGLVKGYLDASLFHEWPSTTPNPDNELHHHVATYNATTIILDFFSQNPLNSSNASNASNVSFPENYLTSRMFAPSKSSAA